MAKICEKLKVAGLYDKRPIHSISIRKMGLYSLCRQPTISTVLFFFPPHIMIVQSHVKEMLSKMDLRCGGDFCDALAKACEDMVKKAAWRCKENKRQTVYGCDC